MNLAALFLIASALFLASVSSTECGCQSTRWTGPVYGPPQTIANPQLPSDLPLGSAILNCRIPNTVAFTLDDGPDQVLTPKLLDIVDGLRLEGIHIKLTFFLQGNNVNRLPTIVKRIWDSGHQIASHSFDHPDFRTLTDAQIESQLTLTDAAIKAVIGVRPRYFRLPYGEATQAGLTKVGQMDFFNLRWSYDTFDWKSQNTEIYKNEWAAYLGTKPVEGMTLSHDIQPTTIAGIETVLRAINLAGYKLVTAAECLGQPGTEYRY